MSIRDIKRTARRRLHDKMKVAARYLTGPLDTPGLKVTVRLHTKWDAFGDQKGTSLNSAELEAMVPKIVLMLDQIPSLPARSHIISVAPGEAYFIDFAEEPDDITVTVHVKPMSPAQTVNFPVPGDDG